MNPKLVLIFWPHAVGKMTVGQELTKITWLKLFHNHMTIDLVSPLLWYGDSSPIWTNLVHSFRKQIFEEFSKSNMEWIIFTFIWDFGNSNDKQFFEELLNLFNLQWNKSYLIELEANITTRKERNFTDNRLLHKPIKRNIERSKKDLEDWYKNYRLNSIEWEITEKNYIKIDNTNLTPWEVANQIKSTFNL